jgi:hypothetical protein
MSSSLRHTIVTQLQRAEQQQLIDRLVYSAYTDTNSIRYSLSWEVPVPLEKLRSVHITFHIHTPFAVRERLRDYFRETYGNSVIVHYSGGQIAMIVEFYHKNDCYTASLLTS